MVATPHLGGAETTRRSSDPNPQPISSFPSSLYLPHTHRPPASATTRFIYISCHQTTNISNFLPKSPVRTGFSLNLLETSTVLRDVGPDPLEGGPAPALQRDEPDHLPRGNFVVKSTGKPVHPSIPLLSILPEGLEASTSPIRAEEETPATERQRNLQRTRSLSRAGPQSRTS